MSKSNQLPKKQVQTLNRYQAAKMAGKMPETDTTSIFTNPTTTHIFKK